MRTSRIPFLAGSAAIIVVLGAASLATRQQQAGSSATPGPAATGIRFTTLPDFRIERVVPAGKTDTYVVMTFDAKGQLAVSKEQDHPRLLLDGDGDGIFETEKIVSDKVRNCQGLWYDGPVLYGHCAPADAPPPGPRQPGRSGLYRMEDTNGDDVMDTFEELGTYVGGIQEHGPHAIRRGPDGEMTLILGNNTFLADESRIDPSSPFGPALWRESQFMAQMQDGRGFGPSTKEGAHGTLHWYDRKRNKYVVFAGGLRNAYDHAFNLAGEAFTFDSDMEWDINLPWYREIRTVHMIPGGDGGYRNGSGKLPNYYIDSLPPVRELGRGSPVGVEFYQHYAYPAEFYDAFFEGDWSRGRLLYTALTPKGATYAAREDRAEFVHGEPLNITDLEVGPDGMVYFTVGGRMTEGGVYRVRYTGKLPAQEKPSGILAAVRQPQPLSSWGWAALEKMKGEMGPAWGSELEKLARGTSGNARDRAQAVYLLQRHGPAPSVDLLTALVKDKEPQVRAAAVYVAGVQGDAAKAVAVTALKDRDPFVQRRAAEALVRMGQSADRPSLAPVADILALLNSPDRYVRFAGRLLLQRTPRAEWKDKVLAETNPLGAIEGMVAYTFTATSPAELGPVFDKQLKMLKDTSLSIDDQLRLLRAFQLAAIEAKTTPEAVKKQVHTVIAPRFPAKDERLNREMAAILAHAGQPGAIGEILAAMPEGDTNQPLQIHYINALKQIDKGWTLAEKEQVMDWFARATAWRGGASFPGSLNLLFDGVLAYFSEDEKKMAYEKVPQFAPLTPEELAKMSQRPGRGGGARLPGNTRTGGLRVLSPEEIMDEQIFTPQRTQPVAEKGRPVYEKVCAQCHRFGAIGQDFGPDLTTLRGRFQKKDVLEAILWPSKAISEQYESTEIHTKDGNVIFGIVEREDDQRLVVRRNQAERPVEIPKAQVAKRSRSDVSLMPEGLVDDLSQQDLANLLAFLLADPPQQ